MSILRGFIHGTVFALLSASLLSANPNYTFTNVDYDSAASYEADPYGLNDSGDVLILSWLKTGGYAILVATEKGPIINIANTDEIFVEFQMPVMNKHRDIAFFARLADGTSGIFLTRNGETTTIATSKDGFEFSGYYLTDRADVYFTARLKTGEFGIFVFDGKSLEKIGSTGSVRASLAAVNNKGTVLLTLQENPYYPKLVTFDRGKFTTVAECGVEFFWLGLASINDHDEVAFSASLLSGGTAVYKFRQGLRTLITTGQPYDLFQGTSINDKGLVSFFLDRGGLPEGIQIGPDPVRDVIRVGDPLFGSTVTGAYSREWSLNNRGQIVFLYGLASGKGGIAVATPIH